MSKWYGVKTLFRTWATGRPLAIDRDYDPAATLIEERVLVYLAKSFDDAIRKAERDAEAYAAGTHRNPYGQLVRTRYLGACDAFELFEPLHAVSGSEVYSRTELAPRTESHAAVCRRLLGRETMSDSKRRRNVLNAELSGSVRRTTRARGARGTATLPRECVTIAPRGPRR